MSDFQKKTTPLRRAEQYHAENLAIARQILATDEQGLRREWAELVVARDEAEKPRV